MESHSSDDPNTATRAKQMLAKLESLDNDFRTQHFALIDLLEEQSVLDKEQEELDNSDSQKPVYLHHSVKDGSAKSVIEGLSCSG